MASQQTVTFNIDVPFRNQNGLEQVRTCALTLTLLVDDLLGSALKSSEGPGEITINGAVMPVDDPKGGAPSSAAAPKQDDLAKWRAA